MNTPTIDDFDEVTIPRRKPAAPNFAILPHDDWRAECIGDYLDSEDEVIHDTDYGQNGIVVIQEGLHEYTFSDFMVDQTHLTQEQLILATTLQSNSQKTPIGQCVRALGFLPASEIDRLVADWKAMDVVEI